MIHLPASVRVYLCLKPCDMRRSFDGLHALVRDHLELDALAGHLYLFANKRRDRLKILYWDRDGFAIWAKRLEQGSYVIRKRLVNCPCASTRECGFCLISGLIGGRGEGLPVVRQ
jgi:transposase